MTQSPENFENQIWQTLGQGMANIYIANQTPGPDGITLEQPPSETTLFETNPRGLKNYSDSSDEFDWEAYEEKIRLNHVRNNGLFEADSVRTHIQPESQTAIMGIRKVISGTVTNLKNGFKQATNRLATQFTKEASPKTSDISKPTESVKPAEFHTSIEHASPSNRRKRMKKYLGGLATVAILTTGGLTFSAISEDTSNQEASKTAINQPPIESPEITTLSTNETNTYTQAERFYSWAEDHPGHDAQTAFQNVITAEPQTLKAVYEREVELAKSGFYGPYDGELPLWLQ